MTQALRWYQTEAIRRVNVAWQTQTRVLLTSPTGSGKSTMLAEIIRAETGRVLVIAHRKELIHQLAERILLNHDIACGIIMAGHPKQDRRVQVASIQTLVRRTMPPADVLIIDEAHHAKAATYEKVLAFYPDARVLGCTATPWRLDGRGLGDLFSENIVAATPKTLMAGDFLVPATGHAYLSPNLANVAIKGGDYDQGGLSLAYESQGVLADIVAKHQQYYAGMRTVCFASSIDNSKHLVERWRALGVAAEHLDHTSKDRDDILRRVRSGKTTVISNVGILGEGIDVPELQCCVLARPTTSVSLFLQMVGRVLRPAPGKTLAHINDHAGCIMAHGLHDMLRDYSLDTTKPKKPAPPALKDCPSCYLIVPVATMVCPDCGYEWTRAEPPEKSAEYIEKTLEELRKLHESSEYRSNLLAQLEAEARLQRRNPGWVIHKYKEKIPEAPFPAKWWRSSVVGQKGAWSFRPKVTLSPPSF